MPTVEQRGLLIRNWRNKTVARAVSEAGMFLKPPINVITKLSTRGIITGDLWYDKLG